MSIQRDCGVRLRVLQARGRKERCACLVMNLWAGRNDLARDRQHGLFQRQRSNAARNCGAAHDQAKLHLNCARCPISQAAGVLSALWSCSGCSPSCCCPCRLAIACTQCHRQLTPPVLHGRTHHQHGGYAAAMAAAQQPPQRFICTTALPFVLIALGAHHQAAPDLRSSAGPRRASASPRRGPRYLNNTGA